MSGFDPEMLCLMGIEEVAYDFPIPLYTRYQMTPYQGSGLTLHHAQPRPLSETITTRLMYQIVDLQKFLRYMLIHILIYTIILSIPLPKIFFKVSYKIRHVFHLY
jgi:hypothetical protein